MMSDHGPWPVEVIPADNDLFYRIDRGAFSGNDFRLHPGVFRENRGSMSCDWERYSTAEKTRARTGRPQSFGVLRMNTGKIQSLKALTVIHDPDFPASNRAHTAVLGLGPRGKLPPQERAKRDALRLALSELFNSWEIPPDDLPKDVSPA
jgi:hypothetical protein